MAERVPELRNLPSGLVLDGELVAFNEVGASALAARLRASPRAGVSDYLALLDRSTYDGSQVR